MAERLLVRTLRQRVGDQVDGHYLSHGAGTGSWHVGEPMDSPAARQLLLRGADPSAFKARRLTSAMIDTSDLILCATSEHVAHVVDVRPDATARTFVLGELGRLLAAVDMAALPSVNGSPQDAYERGVALVVAVDTARGGGSTRGSNPQRRRPARRSDDLADPWGMSDREFAGVADQIEQTIVPLAAALTGHDPFPPTLTSSRRS